MTPLRQRMIEDMQLRGLSEITQDRYVRAVPGQLRHPPGLVQDPGQVRRRRLIEAISTISSDFERVLLTAAS